MRFGIESVDADKILVAGKQGSHCSIILLFFNVFEYDMLP